MRQSLLHRRIPTLFALLLLLVGLVATGALVQNRVFTTSKATPFDQPQDIEITNITQQSFTVTFTTLDPTIAAVHIENKETQSLYYDARDTSGKHALKSHFITISNLQPESKYTFTVISNGNTYQQNGKSFVATTASKEASQEASQTALSGSVILSDGTPGSDVLIQASIPNVAPVSAITDSQGNFTISQNLIRNPSHNQLVSLTPGTEINLIATQGSQISKISYTYQPDGNIPAISLSQNYNFVASEEENNGSASSLLTAPTATKQPPQVKILIPKADESFTDLRPQFRGTALPNTLITITIHSGPITVTLRTDPNGNWTYRPAVALSAGAHTITIQSPNINGVMQSATASFTVFASGSQIAESATPSATPTTIPTPTPTAQPTNVPTATPTPTPTPSTITPTPTGSNLPTSTPTPTVTPTPTTIPTPTPTIIAVVPTKPLAPPPPTGETTNAIILTTISILFIVSGSALLFIL